MKDRCLRIACAIAVGLWAVPALAQFEVELKLDNPSYLKYEPIMAHVRISNFTGHTIGLFNHNGKPWLSFYVSRLDGEQVDDLGVEYDLQQVQIAGNDSLTMHVNLTPVYNIRDPGLYRVMAIVYSASYNQQYRSNLKEFDLTSGRVLWRETVAVLPTNQVPTAATSTNLASSASTNEEWRTYELVTTRVGRNDRLYARVESEANNAVYATIPLGVLVGFGKPEVKVDSQSHLHVLHQVGSRAFTYVDIAPTGKLANQRAYSNIKSKPELKIDKEGKAFIEGGEQTYPNPAAFPQPLSDFPLSDTPPPAK